VIDNAYFFLSSSLIPSRFIRQCPSIHQCCTLAHYYISQENLYANANRHALILSERQPPFETQNQIANCSSQ